MAKKTTKRDRTLLTFQPTTLQMQAIEGMRQEWASATGKTLTDGEIARRLVTMACCNLHPKLFVSVGLLAQAQRLDRGDGWDDVLGNVARLFNEHYEETKQKL